MLDFVIFAIAFVTFLVALVFHLYPGARKTGTTIPGMNPSDPKEGNLLDVQQAGSLHEYLRKLHEEYGEIASFWLETQLIVSLASQKLFAEHQHVFDRPGDQFHYLRPLFGDHSVFFANGAKARQQHALLTDVLSRGNQKQNEIIYKQMTRELIDKLEKLPVDQHIPLNQYMLALSVKIILITLFGDYFLDSSNVIDFRSQLDLIINHLDQKLYGQHLSLIDNQQKKVDQAIEFIRSKAKLLLSKKNGLIADLSQKNSSEDQNIDDAVTILYEGYITIANFLTWALYYIAIHADIQEKLLKEILSSDEGKDLSQLEYLDCVLKETLRISCLRPFVARFQDIDVEIGGHIIPKETPVIHALGVVMESENVWNNPKKFDPERFTNEQFQGKSGLEFCPFGIGNKRQCPGKSFAMNVVKTVVRDIILNLKVTSLDCQVERNFKAVVTKPEEDIWITILKRS